MMFNSLMHVSFYTDNMDEMLEFYCDRMGLKKKSVVRYKEYKGNKNRPELADIAESDPERIMYIYIEIAPGQFLELFPKAEGQLPHREWNQDVGYSHFSLTVDDIFETVEKLKSVGIEPIIDISKGPSETYRVWYRDPDGNRFEVMQYTERSWQVVGHFS